LQDKRDFDCASCKSDRKCFYKTDTLIIDQAEFGKGRKRWEIKDWDGLCEYIDHFESLVGPIDELEAIYFVSGSDICPIPFITDLSVELSKMDGICGEHLFPYPGAYFDQLSIYIQAKEIIAGERAKHIERLNAKNQNG
jgi:hypothetical protein